MRIGRAYLKNPIARDGLFRSNYVNEMGFLPVRKFAAVLYLFECDKCLHSIFFDKRGVRQNGFRPACEYQVVGSDIEQAETCIFSLHNVKFKSTFERIMCLLSIKFSGRSSR